MKFVAFVAFVVLGGYLGSEWGSLGGMVGVAVGSALAIAATAAGELRLIRKALEAMRGSGGL